MGFRQWKVRNNRAKHILSFGCIYSHPKPCDIIARIKISVNSINRAVCISAFKHFICSFTNMFTFVAGLRSITRVNNNQLNSIKQSLVFKFCPQICERPSTKFSFKLLRTSFACKSNVSQVFNCNTVALLFSSKYNRFC